MFCGAVQTLVWKFMNERSSPSIVCDWSADNSWSLSDESAETNIDPQQ